MNQVSSKALWVGLAVLVLAGAAAFFAFTRVPAPPEQATRAQAISTPEVILRYFPKGLSFRGGNFEWESIPEQRGEETITYVRGVLPDRSLTIVIRPSLLVEKVTREDNLVEHSIKVPVDGQTIIFRIDQEAADEVEELLRPLTEDIEAKVGSVTLEPDIPKVPGRPHKGI